MSENFSLDTFKLYKQSLDLLFKSSSPQIEDELTEEQSEDIQDRKLLENLDSAYRLSLIQQEIQNNN
jgi:hypothetical protein